MPARTRETPGSRRTPARPRPDTPPLSVPAVVSQTSAGRRRLEHRVQRLQEPVDTLTTANDELGHLVDVTSLKASERALQTAREQLTADLRRMTILHNVSQEQLVPSPSLDDELRTILRAALDVTGADGGVVQLAEAQGVLSIVAADGVVPPYLDHFALVDANRDCMCAHALTCREHVAISDVNGWTLPPDSPTLSILRESGIRALQSTPLFDREGDLIGMISTHYRDVHGFTATELRWLDLLSARASLVVERHRLEDVVTRARRTLERKVADSTQDLRLALEAAQASTWHIDLRTMTVRWDDRSKAMFGAETETHPFDPTFPEAHPDDRDGLQRRFSELWTPGDDLWNQTFRVLQPDGAVRWVHGVGRVERDADGSPMALSGINLDVTEQKQIELDLEAARQRQSEAAEMIERLLGGATEGILTTTESGVIERANPSLEAMFGYAPGELTGQPLARLVPEAYQGRHATVHTGFFTTDRSRAMGEGPELLGLRKDGSTFSIEVSLTTVMTSSGRRALAFVSDVTERKRAEEELRRSHAILQAQAATLHHRTLQLRHLASELTLSEQQTRERLAKVVHDHLQQVLFGAKWRVDRLLAAPDGGADIQALAGKVQEDLAAAVAAARSLSVELFPPTLHQGGLGPALIWLATWMQERHGLTVEVTADPEATLEPRDLRTLAFESVRELLFNVVKHAGVTRASVALTPVSDDRLKIVVADEGVGFEVPRVFGSLGHPSGWGLFSVRERVELLGGRLDVESAPGRGSRFTIVMPRTEIDAHPDARRLRILIADDHAMVRASLREMLTERPEFEVVGEACTGMEAMAFAQTHTPDVIIMDVVMPQLDGVAATRNIHAEYPAIQIVGLSAQQRTQGLHPIQEAGAAAYFTKDDDRQHLLDWLHSLHESLYAHA